MTLAEALSQATAEHAELLALGYDVPSLHDHLRLAADQFWAEYPEDATDV
jgi:hypothetical protein